MIIEEKMAYINNNLKKIALFKKNVANWINTNILKSNRVLKKNIIQIMIKISIKVGVYNDYWKTSCSIFEK